jgi:hypothetical protein
MGTPAGTLTFSLRPYGTVLIDVAREDIGDDEHYGTFSLCYAQKISNELPRRDGGEMYLLTLRAEGAGSVIRCALDLGGNLTWRMDGLKL